jgi:hypothetical protein
MPPELAGVKKPPQIDATDGGKPDASPFGAAPADATPYHREGSGAYGADQPEAASPGAGR